MTDEVTRLRRLRKSALKLRALAGNLRPGPPARSVQDRVALLGWRIARIATGSLRSHPYKNYQKDQGAFESLVDQVSAYGTAAFAKLRGRGIQALFEELSSASRELDDTRALTLSAHLSDALGRAQGIMRELIDATQAQIPTGSRQRAQTRSGEAQNSSPYLAL